MLCRRQIAKFYKTKSLVVKINKQVLYCYNRSFTLSQRIIVHQGVFFFQFSKLFNILQNDTKISIQLFSILKFIFKVKNIDYNAKTII